MPNPIFNKYNHTPTQGFNPIANALSPQQIVQSALQQNPQLRQQLQFMQNQARSHNMTDEQYARQWFKQQQIPEQQMIDIANKFGLR